MRFRSKTDELGLRLEELEPRIAPGTFTSGAVNLPIPDLDTAVSTMPISDASQILDLNVQMNITHTFDGDLRIFLVAPDGTPVTLVDQAGGPGDNFTGTVLDDEAAVPISSGAAPFTGTFRPEQALSVLDGMSLQGTWTLRVEDTRAGDIGTLQSWSLLTTVIPSIVIAGASKMEGDAGTTDMVFTVTLGDTQGQGLDVSMQYATSAGTATAGSDYTSTSGVLTIPAGQTSGTIGVPIVGDILFEADETFTLNLSNPTNATLGTGVGTGTIQNDDAPPTITINDVSQLEGNAGQTDMVFTVSLSSVSGLPVTVDYATSKGTATAGSDYTTVGGTLTIGVGQTSGTIGVPILGDTTNEGNETFFVNLSNPANATIADGQGRGTIWNDDGIPLVLSAANPWATFRDGDWDLILLSFSGWAGTATIADDTGNAPNFTDIATVDFAGTDGGSGLLAQDLDPVGTFNTLTLGDVTSPDGVSLGSLSIVVSGSDVFDTCVDIGGALTTFYVFGNATGVDLYTGGPLTQEIIFGNATFCNTMVDGNVGAVQVWGNVVASTFDVCGDLTFFNVFGTLAGSDVTFDGSSAAVSITGAVTDSLIGGLIIQFFSAASLDNTVVGGLFALNTAYCGGNMTDSLLFTGSDANLFFIQGGVFATDPDTPVVQVGNDLSQLVVYGPVVNSEFDIMNNLHSATFLGPADHATLNVFGNLTQATFMGAMTNDTIGVAGHTNMFQAFNGQTNSTLNFATGVDSLYLFGGMTGVNTASGGDVFNFYAAGNITGGSSVIIMGNAAAFNCTGAIDGGSTVHVMGDTTFFQVGQGIKGNSTLDLDGAVTTAYIFGAPGAASLEIGSIIRMGSLRSALLMFGTMAGAINIADTAAGSTMSFMGDVTGNVAASVFGNVIVYGRFTGVLGSPTTVPGVGNLLWVTVPGGGGWLVPNNNIFATRIGYP